MDPDQVTPDQEDAIASTSDTRTGEQSNANAQAPYLPSVGESAYRATNDQAASVSSNNQPAITFGDVDLSKIDPRLLSPKEIELAVESLGNANDPMDMDFNIHDSSENSNNMDQMQGDAPLFWSKNQDSTNTASVVPQIRNRQPIYSSKQSKGTNDDQSVSSSLKKVLLARQLKFFNPKDASNADQNDQKDQKETDDENELRIWHETKREFMRKKSRGQLSFKDEVEFERKTMAHNNYVRKSKLDAIHDTQGEIVHDEDFALPETDKKSLNETPFEGVDPDDDSGMVEGIRCFLGSENARPQSADVPSPARSATPASSKEAKTATKKKGRQRKPAVTKKKVAKNPKAEATAAKRRKKMTKAERNTNNLFNPANVYASNLFEDIAASSGLVAVQPSFKATVKKDALKQLVASIPIERRQLARIDQGQLEEASKKFTGNASCKADGDGGWKVRGMESSLTHYQMLGVAFMRERESSATEPQGGIQADAMGLGKTVMMTANIINGRQDNIIQPTLVVAAPVLLQQWGKEVPKHAAKGILNARGKKYPYIYRYVRAHCLSQPDPVEFLSDYDMIFATYDEVRLSYPKFRPPEHLATKEEKLNWWKVYYEKNKGVFHRMKFHRVVLDEAHAIKNPYTATSVACRGIQATHRWAMSGTPVQNSLAEFYPYFQFLKVPSTGNFATFCQNFITEDSQGAERLYLVLRQFMVRRTHSDELFGARLLDLPPPTRVEYPCHLDAIERAIYDVVHQRVVQRINGYLSIRDGPKPQYCNVLTLLLLLRMIVDHPLLVQEALRIVLEPEDFDTLEKIAATKAQLESHQEAILKSLRVTIRVARENQQGLTSRIESNASQDTDQDRKVNLPQPMMENIPSNTPRTNSGASKARGHSNNLHRDIANEGSSSPRVLDLTDRTNSSTNNDKAKKAASPEIVILSSTSGRNKSHSLIDLTKDDDISQSPMESRTLIDLTQRKRKRIPQSVSVGGAYGKKNDIAAYMKDLRPEAGSKHMVDLTVCVECKNPPTDAQLMDCRHIYCNECLTEVLAAASRSGNSDAFCRECRAALTQGKPSNGVGSSGVMTAGAAKPTVAQKLKDAQINIDNWIDSKGKMIPSAKTMAIKAQVMNWFEEDPTVKIIIYTQFLVMVRILEKICKIEGWKTVQFTGMQTVKARSKAIEDFGKEVDGPSIMISSLKSGGIGLNLVMASRVIITEPWWNLAVENQAFCRTFRRGQTRETVLSRFLVQGTVEDQIMAMQRRKEAEIGSVVDNKTKANKEPTFDELLSLFGDVRKDKRGNTFIVASDTASNVPLRIPNQKDPEWDMDESI